MAAMERLLSAGSPLELSAEDLAHENVAVKMVQREMSEADEANLLEEEDMHVFECEPLTDRLPLVSCNNCKKPIKSSQYSAHAERCRSFTAVDDAVMEIDGGANHKKPPRKARKKLPVGQDNLASAGGKERLQPLDADDAALPDSVGTSAGDSQDQVPARASVSNARRPPKIATFSDGSTSANDGSTAGKGSTNTMHADGRLSPAKRVKLPKHDDVDLICGVSKEQGTVCRQPLTCHLHSESAKRSVTGRRRPYDVLLQESKANSHSRLRSSKVHDSGVDPLPMTTKVYYLGHHHRMRAVLGNLFREAHAVDPSCSPSPNSGSNEQGVPISPPASLHACLDGTANMGQPQAFDKQVQRSSLTLDATFSQPVDLRQGHSGGLRPTSGLQTQPDSKFSSTGRFGFGKGMLVNGTQQPSC